MRKQSVWVVMVAMAVMARLASADVVTSIGNGDWGLAGTWDLHVPTAGDVAIINNDITLSSPSASLAAATVNGTLTFSGWNTVLDASSVNVNGTINHLVNSDTNGGDGWTPDNRIKIQCAALLVAGGGKITADAKGYQAGYGPGKGTDGDGGGGYGGVGGPYTRDQNGGGLTYGSADMPTDPGSGGGNTAGFAGGGAIWIEAINSVLVDGTITADGAGAPTYTYNPDGSGGSIYITTRVLSGAGSITATGGGQTNPTAWSYNRGAGGGGRIALAYAKYLVDPGFIVDMSGGTVLGSTPANNSVGGVGSLAITIIPEPASLVLLGFGVLFAVKRPWRNEWEV